MNRRVSHQSESHLRLGMASKIIFFFPNLEPLFSGSSAQFKNRTIWEINGFWGKHLAFCILWQCTRLLLLPVRVGIPLRLGSNSNPPLQRGDDLGTGLGASPWRLFPSRPFSNNRDIINCNLCNQHLLLLPHPNLIPKHLLNKMD